MKITIENFGPIKEFSIDLSKKLTFVYGKNSTGKSYAISLVYLILKNLKGNDGVSYVIPKINKEQKIFLEKINKEYEKIKSLADKNSINNDFDITVPISSIISLGLEAQFLQNFETSLKSSYGNFSALNNKFNTKPFLITIEIDIVQFILTNKKDNLILKNFKLRKKVYCSRSIKNSGISVTDDKVILSAEDVGLDKVKDFKGSSFLSSMFFLYKTLYFPVGILVHRLYFLPASRAGLYQALNAFSQIIAELSKKRNFLNQKIELPAISEQISDYFLALSEIQPDLKKDDCYPKVAADIEKSLIKGIVKFDSKTKKLIYHQTGIKSNFDLSQTSSMVSEISPLVAYLKYVIQKPDISENSEKTGAPLLFIEEPEAHLHPEAQVLLMEFFQKMTKAGIHLIITSHSNYMFSKLNNMILQKKLKVDEVQAFTFVSNRKGTVAKAVALDDLGFDDDNFRDTAEALYEESLALIDQRNAEHDQENSK